MFLYELALELGVRSTALLDRAQAMGMQVDTTAQLTPEQIEELRAAYGKGRGHQTQDHATAQARAAAESALKGGDGAVGAPAIAAMVVAGLVVVLLVGYMLTNSDNDNTATTSVGAGDTTEAAAGESTTTEPCDAGSGIGVGAIGQDPAAATTAAPAPGASAPPAATALAPCDVVGALEGEEIAATTAFDGDPLDLPRDKREFCKAALSIVDFQTRLYDAANLDELGPIRDVMLSGKDQFMADLANLQATAPPRLDGPLDRYDIVYSNLFGSITPGVDDYTLAVAFIQASRSDLAYYENQIGAAVAENCDKR